MLKNTYLFSPVANDGMPNFKKGSYEYNNWWKQQKHYCLNGYEVDEVRITGVHYFYLNFWKMKGKNNKHKSKTKLDKDNNRKGLISPKFTQLDYDFFFAVETARANKKHLCCAKRRQCGFSEKAACLAAYEFIFFPYSQIIIVAGESSYSEETMKNTHRGLNALQDTEFYKRTSPSGIEFAIARYKEPKGKVWKGYMSELHCMTAKNNSQVTIGKSFGKGTKCIMLDGSFKNVEDIKPGDLLMGPDSKPRTVQTIHSGKETLYKIKQRKGIDYVVNESHLMYFHASKNKAINPFNNKFSKQHDSSHLIIEMKDFVNQSQSFKKSCMAEKSGLIEFNKKYIGDIDPYFIGLWLGDGDTDRLQITSIDNEIINYIHDFANKHNYKVTCNEGDIRYYITNSESYKRKNKNGNPLKDWFKRYNLFYNKHIPELYLKNDKSIRLNIIAGIIDSDGHKCEGVNYYEVCTKYKAFSNDIEFLCRSLGFSVTIKESRSKLKGKDCGPRFRIFISGDLHTIPIKIARKKFTKKHIYNTNKSFNRYGITYENLGIGDYYGFTVDSDHLFLLEDFTIVHNTPSLIIFEEAGKFPNLLECFNYIKPALEAEGEVTGFALVFGTGGEMSKGADQLMKMFYNPSAYNMQEYDDIYSETWDAADVADRKKVGYFVPAWRYLMIDEDGNDLYQESIDYRIKQRDIAKESTNSKTYFDEITQHPIYTEECFLISDGTYFPSAKLNRRLAEIRRSKEQSSKGQRGNLHWIKQDKLITGVRWEPDNFGHVLIFEHPELDSKGKVPDNLYFAGTDSYDRDQAADSLSLGSCSMIKGFYKSSHTFNNFVARITYRPETAEEFYEITAKLCTYYGDAENLIEYSNLGIFKWYKDNGFSYLLKGRPELAYANVKASKMQNRDGIDPATKFEWLKIYKDYVENNWDKLEDEEQILRLIKYRLGPDYNCDVTISGALAVVHMEDNKDLEVRESTEQNLAKFRLSFKFEGGKLTRKYS